MVAAFDPLALLVPPPPPQATQVAIKGRSAGDANAAKAGTTIGTSRSRAGRVTRLGVSNNRLKIRKRRARRVSQQQN